MRREALRVERDGIAAFVTLDGEIDAARAAAMREPLLTVPEARDVALVIDLSAVSYLDSAGVHLLLHLHRELGRRGYALHLVAPQRRTPALVLEVTDVAGAIALHPDRAAALSAIDPPAS